MPALVVLGKRFLHHVLAQALFQVVHRRGGARIHAAVAGRGQPIPGVLADRIGRLAQAGGETLLGEAAHRRRHAQPVHQRRGQVDALLALAQHALVPVLVETFVQHRLLELVRGEQAIEITVAELVDGHEVDRILADRARVHLAVALGGEERGVLHAAGFAGVVRRHYGSQRLVRIRAQRPGEIPERIDAGLQHRLGAGLVLGRIDHPHRHLRTAGAFIRAVQRLVTLGRHPGEVVHVALHEVVGGLAALALRLALQLAHRADGVVRRHRELDVVQAEVRIELAVEMELVAVPAHLGGAALARQLQHADLRKPLADQVEVAEPAGALHHPRQLAEEVDVQRQRAARRHRLGQVDAHHAAVGRRTVVRLHEAVFQVGVGLAHAVEVDPAPLPLLQAGVAA